MTTASAEYLLWAGPLLDHLTRFDKQRADYARRCSSVPNDTTTQVHRAASTRPARHWPGLQTLVAGPLAPDNSGEAFHRRIYEPHTNGRAASPTLIAKCLPYHLLNDADQVYHLARAQSSGIPEFPPGGGQHLEHVSLPLQAGSFGLVFGLLCITPASTQLHLRLYRQQQQRRECRRTGSGHAPPDCQPSPAVIASSVRSLCGTNFPLGWHPVISRRAYAPAAEHCFWKPHLARRPAACSGVVSPACVSSGGSSFICSICSCCVLGPVDPPCLPLLRIVANAEWSVPCASGATMSQLSQLPGMATSPMQLHLLRHVGLRLMGDYSMRAESTW